MRWWLSGRSSPTFNREGVTRGTLVAPEGIEPSSWPYESQLDASRTERWLQGRRSHPRGLAYEAKLVLSPVYPAVVPKRGIEPLTSSMSTRCSTAELLGQTDQHPTRPIPCGTPGEARGVLGQRNWRGLIFSFYVIDLLNRRAPDLFGIRGSWGLLGLPGETTRALGRGCGHCARYRTWPQKIPSSTAVPRAMLFL